MLRTRISRRALIKAGLGAATVGFAPASDVSSAETGDATEAHNSASFVTNQDSGSIPLKRPIDYVNVLFGTGSLDDQQLIGNAPPPGEELYNGMVCPGATLPYAITDVSPVNKDISLAYPHGNLYSYAYPRRTMVGFSNMVPNLLLMPLVGDWTTPPDRIRYASLYSKESEKSSPGYYTVYLPDHKVKVDLTATMGLRFIGSNFRRRAGRPFSLTSALASPRTCRSSVTGKSEDRRVGPKFSSSLNSRGHSSRSVPFGETLPARETWDSGGPSWGQTS
jgi:hypothetical protein